MIDSKVMQILKARVYYGKTKDTTIEDLKLATKEILDWVDITLERERAVVKQELKQSLEARLPKKYELTLEATEARGWNDAFVEVQKAIDFVFQDKGDNRE